jgi:hypothetical protein
MFVVLAGVPAQTVLVTRVLSLRREPKHLRITLYINPLYRSDLVPFAAIILLLSAAILASL